MATVSFSTYRQAYEFLFAARELGFVASLEDKAVTVGGVPCDDARWETLSNLIGPF